MNKNYSAIREAGCKISFVLQMNSQIDNFIVRHLRIQSLVTQKFLGCSNILKEHIVFNGEQSHKDAESAPEGSPFDLAMVAAIEECNSTFRATIARILALKEADELASITSQPQANPARKSGRL